MLSRTRILPFCCVVLILFAAVSAGAADKSCIDCHKKLTAKRMVHAAIGQFARMEQGCPSCHTAPHAAKKAELSLTVPVPDLCYQCHDKANFTKTNIHPPVAGGACLSCHDPHASDTAPLLSQPLTTLCTGCHPDKNSGRHILGGYGLGDNHPIRGQLDPAMKGRELGCTSCHHPHASGRKNLFINDTENAPDNLCLRCHIKITVRP